MMRSIDHCVLPTADLAMARRRLGALGFTVAPKGVHPFGTENACVYFADGTFLELLAVGDADLAAEAAENGNVFVARDQAYRDALGEEGFSALVFVSADADADHAGFEDAGISAGDRLDFSRPFFDPTGETDTASFRLAFAGAEQTQDALFFTCERVNAPKVDRAALERHHNGAAGIAEIILTARRPSDFSDFLAALTGSAPKPSGGGFTFDLPNAAVLLLSPDAFAEIFGVQPDAPSGLRLTAITFRAPDMAALETGMTASGIASKRMADLLVVPAAPGQGALFAFKPI